MFYKKIIILIIILTVIFSTISFISATDNITEYVGIRDENLVESDYPINEEKVFSESINEIGIHEENKFLESTGSFTDLANEIANADDELNLTRNYIYSTSDSNYKSGIIIDKKITINGNGFILDSNTQSRTFQIVSNEVILNNISFINALSALNGAAIYWTGDFGILHNCSFSNCYSNDNIYSYGGAVYWNGVNGTLSNCSFEKCHSSVFGGAVYWRGINGTLSNSSFEKCYASYTNSKSRYGGAVYWNGVNGTLYNCNFLNCYLSTSNENVGHYGGAVYWNGVNGTLYNCNFFNCYIPSSSYTSRGGAIYWTGDFGNLYDCNFVNCSSSSKDSSSDGGGVSFLTDNGILFNCNFINCFVSSKYSNSFGGGIYWGGDEGFLNNCTFLNCYNKILHDSVYSGGSIYWKGAKGIINNSNFNSSSDKNVHWYGGEGVLGNCTFENSNGTTLYWSGSQGILTDSNFKNSSNEWDIYWYGSKGLIIECNFSKIYSNNNCEIYHKSFIKMNITNINVGEKFYLSYLINDNATGKIQIYINNTFKKEIEVNEKVEFDDLKAGIYIIKLIYGGDKSYLGCENNTQLIVSKINTSIDIIPINLNCNNVNIFAILSNKIQGNVTFNINNQNSTFKTVNGFVNITIPHLDEGNYTYTLTYDGDDIYSSFSKNGTLTIKGIIKTIIANDIIVKQGNEYNFNATFLNSDGTPLINEYVIFEVDNHPYISKTNIKGLAILKLKLSSGNYTIISINLRTGENKTNKLIIKAVEPQPIDEEDIYIPSLDESSGELITIRLPNDATGTITLNINGKNYTFNVINGVSDIKVPNLGNGVYNYFIIYSGDKNYSSFTKTGNLTVKKNTHVKPAKITLKLKKVKVKKSAKKLVIKATLKINGKNVKGKKLKFKFKGKKYTSKTNKKGVAKITIKRKVLKKLKIGKKIKYQVTYGKITKKVTVKVKK